MKKYLMTGIAAVAMCAAFTSCSKDTSFEPLTQEQLNEQKAFEITNAYNQAFIKTFGQPAANQTWGFGTAATRGITRGGSQPNQTVWPNYGYPGKPGSLKTTTPSGKSEEQIVTEWFQTHTIADAVTLDCNDYWVLQVHYKNFEYTANQHEWEKYENGREVWKTGTTKINPLGHMDQIFANTNANGTASDHIYNFNTGSGNFMLVLNSETKYGFGYEESWGTDNKHVYGNSFMAHIVDEANGIDGYYVGFDYQAYKLENVQYTNNNGETVTYNNNKAWALEPDGVYDDRIIKIVPGRDFNIIIPEYDGRIMAEDLCATEGSDFDFNDVVFDWKIIDGGAKAEIKLLAAGGTMPLRIGGTLQNENSGVEVHNKFGVDVSIMVNTATDGTPKVVEKPYQTFTITASEAEVEEGMFLEDGSNIPIYVKKEGVWVELTAYAGEPAAKFNCPVGTDWVDEYAKITWAYPDFDNYVSQPGIDWWENVNSTFVDLILSNNTNPAE